MVNLWQVVLTIILIVVVLYLRTPKTSQKLKNRDILIWGLSQSFKTRLYFKLLANRLLDTITSSTINTQTFQLGDHIYSLTDFPGHSSFERELRSQLKQASPVVFMINAVDRHFK